MRVIAGEKRGMTLHIPKGNDIRPTTDKIKGAVFNTIQSRIPGAEVFVDLFGGSGAMAIEALSRGVSEAWIFDCSSKSMDAIKKNIAKARYENRAHCRLITAERGLALLEAEGIQADLIFMDPPYVDGKECVKLMAAVDEKKILKTGGLVVIEHEKSVIIPLSVQSFTQIKEKHYGRTAISYYVGSEEK